MEETASRQLSEPTLKINDIIVYQNNFMCTPSKRNVVCYFYDRIATVIQFIY